MKHDKIMAVGNLDNIIGRLTGCHAVLDTIHMTMEDNPLADAVYGACDLLESIVQDFQADIDGAEDYTGEAAV